MSQLWTDLEQMCGLIKHAPEHVELSQVRALLRRCQHFVDTVTDTLAEATVTLPGERVTKLIDESVSGD